MSTVPHRPTPAAPPASTTATPDRAEAPVGAVRAPRPLATAFVTGGSGFLGRELLRQLAAAGVRARALARSEAAARAVAALGAEPVRGDLLDAAALGRGMQGLDGRPVDVVFHVAGHLDVWGPAEAFRRTNVDGTRAVVAAARAAGVPALVAAGAAAVLMEGTRPLVGADERAPRAWALEDPGAAAWAPYIATKAHAEAAVLAANAPALRAVVVHPPAIWGAGDPHTLPSVRTAVRRFQFVWVSHPGAPAGRYPYATCHVANVAEGLIAAARFGRGGESYLVTDPPEPGTGADVGTGRTFRDWITGMLGAVGVRARAPGLPFGAAWAWAALTERVWAALRLPGTPPITRVMLRLIGLPFTVSDAKARRELGYVGRTSRAAGLAAIREAAGGRASSRTAAAAHGGLGPGARPAGVGTALVLGAVLAAAPLGGAAAQATAQPPATPPRTVRRASAALSAAYTDAYAGTYAGTYTLDSDGRVPTVSRRDVDAEDAARPHVQFRSRHAPPGPGHVPLLEVLRLRQRFPDEPRGSVDEPFDGEVPFRIEGELGAHDRDSSSLAE